MLTIFSVCGQKFWRKQIKKKGSLLLYKLQLGGNLMQVKNMKLKLLWKRYYSRKVKIYQLTHSMFTIMIDSKI